jgi:hypothetical protein
VKIELLRQRRDAEGGSHRDGSGFLAARQVLYGLHAVGRIAQPREIHRADTALTGSLNLDYSSCRLLQRKSGLGSATSAHTPK